jgi:hypothetical protein
MLESLQDWASPLNIYSIDAANINLFYLSHTILILVNSLVILMIIPSD